MGQGTAGHGGAGRRHLGGGYRLFVSGPQARRLAAIPRVIEAQRQAIVQEAAEADVKARAEQLAAAGKAALQEGKPAAAERTISELQDDRAHQEQLQKWHAADAVAKQAEAKTAHAEQDRVEKGRPYEAEPLFMYLWKRGYGTAAYAANPLVLVLEDLHWSDVSTVNGLTYLAQRRDTARLRLLGTYRPADVVVREYPLRGVLQELRGRGLCDELALELLGPAEVAAYVAARLDGEATAALAARLYHQSEGNALFMVHVLEHLVEQGVVKQEGGQWTLGTRIPRRPACRTPCSC